MGIQLSDGVKNIVGNACYEQFLLFPQCFQKQFVVPSKCVSMEKRVNFLPSSPVVNDLHEEESFRKLCRKRGNCW